MRVFFAIPPDPDWVASARELGGRLKTSLPRASWTRPEAWHLTLKFLGEIDQSAAGRFAAAIDAAGTSWAGDEALVSAGSLLLPTRVRPRVLAIGFAPSPSLESLTALARAAEQAGRRIGIPPEDREFRPHLTLARLREPWPSHAVEAFRREADAWPFPPWSLRSCVLFESRLAPAGAVHTPLREWTFGERGVEVRA